MKKKILIVLLSLVCSVCLAIGLSACDGSSNNINNSGTNEGSGQTDGSTENSGWSDGVYTIATAYAQAQALGYSGTLEEFTALISGTDGIDGKDGADGVGIESIALTNTAGNIDTYTITLTNGTTYTFTVTNAETQATVYELTYEANDSGYTVTGISSKKVTSVEIPDSYNGQPVTAIGSSAFANCLYLEEVTIPDSVTLIKNNAFANCVSLKGVDIPSAVTTIEDSAFINCISIEEIVLPTNLEYLGGYVFYGCDSVNSVTLSFGFSSDVGKVKRFIYLFGLYMIDSTTISGDSIVVHPTLVDVTITGETVPENAFFSDCYFIKSITISDSVTTIGENAFAYCYSLESVTIGSGITSISSNAFLYCNSLKNVTIGNNVTSIGDTAFCYCTSLESISIPGSVTTIDSSAFRGCTSLESISLPNSVMTIGNNAFSNCKALVELFISKNVTKIGSYAFENCKCVIIAEAESKPEGWSSNWCSDACLVLWGYSSMPTLKVTYSFVTSGGSLVDSISAVYLTSLPTTTKDGYAFGGWYEDEAFTVKATAPYYKTTDTTLYARWYEVSNQSEGLEIENGVIVGIGTCTYTVLVICMPIAERAFSDCSQVTAVYLYDGCTSIGYQAFSSCENLKEVYFYQTSVPDIGEDMFANTWDPSDFRVYVLGSLYSEYENVSEGCWQNSLVFAGKLYTI